MNGIETLPCKADNFFAKMTPGAWLTMIIVIVTIIGGGFLTYNQVHANTDDIDANRELIQEMHDTQIILVKEVQDMNEWMEKLYDVTVSEGTTR